MINYSSPYHQSLLLKVICDHNSGRTMILGPQFINNNYSGIQLDEGWELPTEEDLENSIATEINNDKWKIIRKERDRLLSETDWITNRAYDRGETVPSSWATYRQSLRDITTQSDPSNITWPTKPE